MDNGVTFSPAGLGVIGALLLALAGAIKFLFAAYAASRDAREAELREQRDSFRKGWEKSLATLEGEAERLQVARGQVPSPIPAPVKAEHNSPSSERQLVAAEFQTLNARHVAATLAVEGVDSAVVPPVPPTDIEKIAAAVKDLLAAQPVPTVVEIVKISPAVAEAIAVAVKEAVPIESTPVAVVAVSPEAASAIKQAVTVEPTR